MSFDLNVAVQIAILTFGIYAGLGFLRAARGSGLVRGIVIATLFIVVFLWWLSWVFAFEELAHIIRGLSGYGVIVLAIVFQPELRRGIAQIGVARKLGSILNKNRSESVSEVVQAVRSMAKRRQGALIAFERETPLDDYIQNGVEIDAAINRMLLDTIFHPGSALHDGAVIIRKDRVMAALCLFPLTENVEIAKSTGTRHRAALGLTDETDAVAVTVSEETGDISLCREGQMVRGIPPKELEPLLRKALASEKERHVDVVTKPGSSLLRRTWLAIEAFFHEGLWRKLASLLLAIAIFSAAHQEITGEAQVSLRVRASATAPAASRSEQLLVQLPGPDFRLLSPREGDTIELVARGRRGDIENVAGWLGGVLTVTNETSPSGVEFPLAQVTWRRSGGARFDNVEFAFAGTRPRLVVERVARRPMHLAPEQLDLRLEDFDSRFVARADEARFDPTRVVVIGPQDRLERLGSESLPLRLAPLVLGPEDRQDATWKLSLAPELSDAGFAFEHGSTVAVTIPVRPSLRDLSSIEREIALVDLSPGADGEARAAWALPPHAQVARFRIRTAGLLPADDPAAPERQAIAAAIRHYVEQNLAVFVDVAELSEGEGRSVRVQHVLRRDWREALRNEGLDFDPRAELQVQLESEESVLLVET